MNQDLIGLHEIAELAGVTTAAVGNWKKRFQDFPKPLKKLKSGPVFSQNQIKIWLKKRSSEENVADIISFVSEKGGVGKTTALIHCAGALQRFHNKKVLVVDADYQRGGLTCRLRPEMLENFRRGESPTDLSTIYHAYRSLYSGADALPDLSIMNTKFNIDLIPADPRLNTIAVDKMPPTNTLRGNNKMLLKHLTLIRDCLENHLANYDFILIDSHPDLHDLEKAVIFASDYCVSPVKLDQQSSIGVPSTIEAINNVDEDVFSLENILEGRTYHNTIFLGALGMMCREYVGLKYSELSIYNRLKRTTGIFKNYITEGDGLRQAAQNGTLVYDVSSQNAQKQSDQFKNFVLELINSI
jgi:chromosome partitioning protein